MPLPEGVSYIRDRVFYGLLTRAGIRKVRFHDLRHTFASLLLQNGESPVYVKEQMGHSSIQITVDLYGHLIPGGNKQAVDRLDTPVDKSRSEAESATQLQPEQVAIMPPSSDRLEYPVVTRRETGVSDGPRNYPAISGKVGKENGKPEPNQLQSITIQ